MTATQTSITERLDLLLREACTINMYDQNEVAEVLVSTIAALRDVAYQVEHESRDGALDPARSDSANDGWKQ